MGVSLSGNTDSRGSAATNEALSRRRATRVRDYLVGKGVEATRITVQALGLTNLKTPETGVVDLARNRRVDITYISGDGHVIETREGLDDLQVEAAARPRPVAKPKKKP